MESIATEPRKRTGTCKARCALTGRWCALPAHSAGEHASGSYRFVRVAAFDQAHFPRAEAIAHAAFTRVDAVIDEALSSLRNRDQGLLRATRERYRLKKLANRDPELPSAESAPDEPSPTINHEEESMSEKTCRKCGNTLRSDNAKGECSSKAACDLRVRHGVGEVDEAPPVAAPAVEKSGRHTKLAVASDPIAEQFRLLTAGLGISADELLREYMQGWIKKVETAVGKQMKAEAEGMLGREP